MEAEFLGPDGETFDDLQEVGGAMSAEEAEEEVGQTIQITADGGLSKKILKLGEGYKRPETGDEVTVHYVGTLLDGTKFDASTDRNEPFKFELGMGRVIKGWDLGVARMRRGEKALLTCRADYAYGKQGSPPKIPADATLQFEVELLSWRSKKDVSGDGGVIKTVTREGKGYYTPAEADEVVVVYSARLAGGSAEVAASPEGGETLTLGAGHALRGLPVALKTMKQGEAAHLALAPEYGFAAGKAGVPEGAALEVSLELAEVHRSEAVTEDGGVVKKSLRLDPEEYERPRDGAAVTASYVGRLPDGTVFDEATERRLELDGEEAPEGLLLALAKMKKGEAAEVSVAPAYGYGDAAGAGPRGNVAPASALVYAVTLHSMENPKNAWEMSNAEKIEAAGRLKERGNAAYAAGKLGRACRFYKRCVELVEFEKEFSDAEKAAALPLKKSAWLNLAAAGLKQRAWKEVLKHCDRVLGLEPTSVKALYRKAEALLALQDYVEAEVELKRAQEQEPASAELARLAARLKAAMKAQNKKEAALYGRMFA